MWKLLAHEIKMSNLSSAAAQVVCVLSEDSSQTKLVLQCELCRGHASFINVHMSNVHMTFMVQVNGEYFGHGTLSMSLQDPSQHHHLQHHHVSMAAMQMPLNPGNGMI